MKRNYLLILACFAFIVSNAQLKEKGVVEITPKIGYSTFGEVVKDGLNANGTKSSGTTDSTTGVSFGVTVDYYFNNRWSLRSGFSLDKMGSKTNAGSITGEDKLNYFSIPVNANWHFGSTRKWNLNFGLSPSFLTSAKYSINGVEKEIPSNAINSFQLGLNYGIGYKIEINKNFGILLDAQLFSGLTDLNNTTNLPGSYKNAGGSYNLGAVIQL
jgi:hypothetical protein